MKRRVFIRSLAVLGLSTGAFAGLGVSSAFAANDCSYYDTGYSQQSNYGAEYWVCMEDVSDGGRHIWWHVDADPASTAERFYVVLHSNCGIKYSGTWNDQTQSVWNDGGFEVAPCASGGWFVDMWPTETGSQSGPTAYAGL